MIHYDPAADAFRSSLLTDHGIAAGFCTRAAGDGRDIEVVKEYFDRQKVAYDSLVILRQCHSNEIVEVAHPDRYELIENVDGAITKEPNTILTVKTADCVPIIVADYRHKILGISHQGWRGTMKRMVQHLVEDMKKLGAAPQDMVAAIGPAIGQCCYEVGADLKATSKKEFPQWPEVMTETEGKTFLNLLHLNLLQLEEVGIPSAHIDFFPFCTHCDPRFFSYRRDANIEGNMLSYVYGS